jgi:hypothetical protein
MADIERAMGRPERAIELSRSPEARELDRNAQIELAIVVAGARRDLEEIDAAVVALQVPELEASRRDPWSARLFYAYADNLLAAGRESDALQWFVHAADADTDGETDADARIADLTGEPLADDGIEFAVDDETPGDDPAAQDSPADNAAAPTDHTVDDARRPVRRGSRGRDGRTADEAAEVATGGRPTRQPRSRRDETAVKATEVATGEASDGPNEGGTRRGSRDHDGRDGRRVGRGRDGRGVRQVDWPCGGCCNGRHGRQTGRSGASRRGRERRPRGRPAAAVATDVATHDPAPQAADLAAADVPGAADRSAAVATDGTAGDLTGAEADGETDDTTDRLAGPAAAAAQDAAETSGDQRNTRPMTLPTTRQAQRRRPRRMTCRPSQTGTLPARQMTWPSRGPSAR